MAALDDQVASAAIGVRVRDFYEKHPYPLGLDDLKGYALNWNRERRRAEAHLFWPEEAFRDDRNILVVGCGTSQAAKHALRWPKAHVTGIDVSNASIEATAKLKRKHSIHNLELRQLPLEAAAELGQNFDQIVCTGVLHHLTDPLRGLCALRDILEPNGAMNLMVYAPYGRSGIYMLQDYCRRLGIGTTTAEIRDLAASLSALPSDHPLQPLLRQAPDFQSEAGLADALLNPQDRAYSVPQLFELIGAAGLEFGRWFHQAPYLPTCGAQVRSPHRARLMNLPPADQYAAIELFRGSMIRHSMIVYRPDRAVKHAITFDGERWLDYVPIRRPATTLISERLPPSAAGVLLNASHSYADIYLPIDAQQRVLFEAIDGVKSIRELAPDDDRRSTARVLFERLWEYDQVVFDTSAATAPSRASA
jgi:SAM-dependent methyltransferase